MANERTTKSSEKKEKKASSLGKTGHCVSGRVVLEVADTGAEIARDKWCKMFVEFKQFDDNDLQVQVTYGCFTYNIKYIVIEPLFS